MVLPAAVNYPVMSIERQRRHAAWSVFSLVPLSHRSATCTECTHAHYCKD
jgi:hypothetical protein